MELLNKLSERFSQGQSALSQLQAAYETYQESDKSEFTKQFLFKRMEEKCDQLEKIIQSINSLMDCRPCSIIMVKREDSVTIAEEVLL